ncbi:hypothetical protein GQ54DRAFT_126117 [Martensiomyces pterosporus]|nr:hypothetical protein GQ54DRAFT_126117 [Martensiomyces pterosporus]
MTLSLCPTSQAKWTSSKSSSASSSSTAMTLQLFDDYMELHHKEEDSEEAKAHKAHELLSSIRDRHTQLARFLQEHRMHKANPLGGAMCQYIEHKIHQLALLIRTQQTELKRIVDSYENLHAHPVPVSRSSSIKDWEEVQSRSADAFTPPKEEQPGDASQKQQQDDTAQRGGSWLATMRVTILKEVIDFSTNDLKRIEESPLLAGFRKRASL